jgi:peptidylprolyl isomerase
MTQFNSGCAMANVRMGDRVLLHFEGRLTDGRVFESTQDAGDGEWKNFRGHGVAFAPLELLVGGGAMLPAFEEALVGLEPGAQTTIEVPMAKAFGPRREELVMVVPREEITPAEQHEQTFRVAEGRSRTNQFNPKPGDVVEVLGPDGAVLAAHVKVVTHEVLTLDANHPLAGHDLVFGVKLVGIVPRAEPQSAAP